MVRYSFSEDSIFMREFSVLLPSCLPVPALHPKKHTYTGFFSFPILICLSQLADCKETRLLTLRIHICPGMFQRSATKLCVGSTLTLEIDYLCLPFSFFVLLLFRILGHLIV